MRTGRKNELRETRNINWFIGDRNEKVLFFGLVSPSISISTDEKKGSKRCLR